MTLHAIGALDDAVDATRAFLTPVDARRWATLAVVALFASGPAGGFNPGVNAPANGSLPVGGGDLPPIDLGPRAIGVIALGVAAVLLVALAFALVGAVMEFVLVESLRHEAVALRAYWGRRWRQGVRLFGFRIALGAVGLAIIAGAVAIVALPLLAGGSPGLSIAAVLALLPVVLLLALLGSLINGFTTVFVVPVMVQEDCGVIAGWRRFWSALAAEPTEYLAYAVLGAVLSLAAGVVLGLVVLVAAVALLVPFGALGAAGVVLLSASTIAGGAVIAVAVAGFGLSMLAVVAVAQVPLVVYLRYYALFVLGATDGDLDLVAERRAAIRDGD